MRTEETETQSRQLARTAVLRAKLPLLRVHVYQAQLWLREGRSFESVVESLRRSLKTTR